MARVTFAVGRPRTRRSCLVLVVSEPQWPHHAVVPSLHLHCQRTLSSAHLFESSISECVRLCDAHDYSLYHMVLTLFHMTFLSLTHHVRMSYVLSENRSSIQSLALMHSATIHCRHHKWSVEIKSHKYIKYMYMPYLQSLDLVLHCFTGDDRCADPVYPDMQVINRC